MDKLFFNDCNVMIGPWQQPLRFETVPDLIREMDHGNIRNALVYHSASWNHHPETGNRMLMDELKGHDRLLPSWAVVPPATGEQGTVKKLVKRMEQEEVRAVRIFPLTQKFLFTDWMLGELFEVLQERQVPVLVHKAELDDNAASIQAVCRTFKELPVILTRCSYFHTRIYYTYLDRYPQFHLDTTTFLAHGGMEDVVEKFGARRLIFGSGLPFNGAGAALAAVNYAQISDADKQTIASGNFDRLFKTNRAAR